MVMVAGDAGQPAAAESALLIPGAFAAHGDYAKLRMPVAIIAGAEDRLIDIEDQSARLHAEIPQSSLERVQGAGHMVHQTAPGCVMAAIERVSHAARTGPSPRIATLSA
jgi:pimeloyl-ACP methyl ester carboxylesterase